MIARLGTARRVRWLISCIDVAHSPRRCSIFATRNRLRDIEGRRFRRRSAGSKQGSRFKSEICGSSRVSIAFASPYFH